jgi:hypothetical protein
MIFIVRQLIKVSAKFAGEGLKTVQFPGIFKNLCIQFKGGMGRVTTRSATTGVFLGMTWMRGGVCPDKETRITGSCGVN